MSRGSCSPLPLLHSHRLRMPLLLLMSQPPWPSPPGRSGSARCQDMATTAPPLWSAASLLYRSLQRGRLAAASWPAVGGCGWGLMAAGEGVARAGGAAGRGTGCGMGCGTGCGTGTCGRGRGAAAAGAAAGTGCGTGCGTGRGGAAAGLLGEGTRMDRGATAGSGRQGVLG